MFGALVKLKDHAEHMSDTVQLLAIHDDTVSLVVYPAQYIDITPSVYVQQHTGQLAMERMLLTLASYVT